uniref:Uncharacterized protein n=1 Tax=Anguilla anguilla TaxID=7936 RepID=A0A0E9P602_ANGAN
MLCSRRVPHSSRNILKLSIHHQGHCIMVTTVATLHTTHRGIQ